MQFRSYFFAVTLLVTANSAWAQQQTCKTANITALTSHLAGKTDGTAADSKTKLMWKRCLEGQTFSGGACSGTASSLSWTEALAKTGSVFANYSNWRLPNIKELQSIVEEQCYGPAINLTAFPGTPAAISVWSNSPADAVSSGSSWYINFYYGDMSYGARSTELLGVRLVRDCTGTECN